MPLLDNQTMILITKPYRKKLKRLAAELDRPMYRVLEELIDAATQELREEGHPHAHSRPQPLSAHEHLPAL